MLDPDDWRRAAQQLYTMRALFPGDTGLRRAVSTAYYALFHTAAFAAAELFAAPTRRHSPAFGLVYRSLDHRRLRDVCTAIGKQPLPAREREQLRRDALSEHTRLFADAIVLLQRLRHEADYNPDDLSEIETFDFIDVADSAATAFALIPTDEKADILALILFRARP